MYFLKPTHSRMFVSVRLQWITATVKYHINLTYCVGLYCVTALYKQYYMVEHRKRPHGQ